MESTPRIEKKIEELKHEFVKEKHTINLKTLYKYKFYIFIPGFFLIFLILLKPSFLYVKNSENKKGKKICVKRFLFFWMLFSLISCSALFFYNFKFSKN